MLFTSFFSFSSQYFLLIPQTTSVAFILWSANALSLGRQDGTLFVEGRLFRMIIDMTAKKKKRKFVYLPF